MTWITPKTNWLSTDFINFVDFNRIENNIAEVAAYLNRIGYAIPVITSNTNRLLTDIDYLSSINRIEQNLDIVRVNFMTPTGWLPVVNWLVTRKFDFNDANRLESDVSLLYTLGISLSQSFVHIVWGGTGYTAGWKWNQGHYIGNFPVHTESTQADFASGTLDNCQATANGLQNMFTYANNYSSSGVGNNISSWTAQAMTGDGAIMPPAGLPNMLKVSTTTTGGSSLDHYTNTAIEPVSGLNITITSGMYLDYWIYLVPGISSYMYSAQIMTSDLLTTSYGNFDGAAVDQNGVRATWIQDLTTLATGQWYKRRISLNTTDVFGHTLIGKVLNGISLFGNDSPSVADGTYVAYFAFSLGYRQSPSINLSSLGSIQSSTVNWTATTPANTSVGLQVSTDGGVTWQNIVNGGTVSIVGATSLLLQENLNTTDTSQSPTLQQVTLSVSY